jgi:hypothetical protein
MGTTRWFVLPALGAGLYALVRSEFFTRHAKGVVEEARTAAEANDVARRARPV